MARWAGEHDYDAIVAEVAAREGVEPALIKAIIAAESAFKPDAFRAEPAINDASRGLMQLLYSTAWGAGYDGGPDGLFDPVANISAGARHLAALIRQTGNVVNAVSAYNGGFRPWLGFGAPLTTAKRLCLARDTATGECVRWYDAKVGEYGNQPYVTKVLGYRDYFRSGGTTTGDATALALGVMAWILGQ